ncbi:MAG: hypothetical protein LC798_15705 [Chloroflexi bacterium]|nr:hypothetical protein [Chloroflexota bacterium]
MTSNQRRPGFRLPWASETDEPTRTADATDAKDNAPIGAPDEAASDRGSGEPGAEGISSMHRSPNDASPGLGEDEQARAPATQPLGATTDSLMPAEPPAGFMRDLVEAMRRVAEETRQASLSDLRAKAEEQVRTLEADAERRREDLRARAETDVAGAGDWAAAERERIKQEADGRVAARRAHLDQQLAEETARAEAAAKMLRDRVAEFEQELDAYHAQLSDIADPAAFAAAAKRMPMPPRLAGVAAERSAPPVEPPPPDEPSMAANQSVAALQIHPAEEEVLASRLAELDAALDDPPNAGPLGTGSAVGGVAAGSSAEPTSTEILIKGLGSFGAITGFRQTLASAEGIEGVSLSLGPTGEFLFRAIHPIGFDVGAAIVKLEGDAATIEQQADGGLRVTLDRAR